MSLVKYTPFSTETGDLVFDYHFENLLVKTVIDSKLVYQDSDSNFRIVFTGEDITLQDGFPTGGTAELIEFKNEFNQLLFSVDGTYDLQALMTTFQTKGFNAFEHQIFAGDDNIFGTKLGDSLTGSQGADHIFGGSGADLLDGGKGDDTLTGGGGADLFRFGSGFGKDKIIGFDANGRKQDNQDFIVVADSKDQFEIRGQGHNTVLDFGNGDVLTLVGVDRSDISAFDIL